MWTVVPTTFRKYGYSLYWNGTEPLSYLTDGRRMGWYKRKMDAQKRADALNEGEANR